MNRDCKWTPTNDEYWTTECHSSCKIAESSKGSYYGLVLNKEDAVRIDPDIKRKHFTIGSVLTK